MLDRLAALETRHRDRPFDDLRRRVLAGDQDAWRAFVEKYSRFVYAVALGLLAGHREPEEAATAVYARVFEQLAAGGFRLLREFQGRCLFTTYLYRVVQSGKREHLQRQASRARSIRESAASRSEVVPGPEGPVLRPEVLRRAVREALDPLDAEERLVLFLRFRDGMKLREIAAVLGYGGAGAAARTLYRALERLDLLRSLGERCRLGTAEMALLAEALSRELSRAAEAAREEV